MTRINVGISPAELCDQHLLAEYRELPRVFHQKFKSEPPSDFRLGSGHVLWTSQFKGTLFDRFKSLVHEMRHRGFSVSYPEPPIEFRDDPRAPREEIERARPILQARIVERLSKMSPRYTNREPPDWSISENRPC